MLVAVSSAPSVTRSEGRLTMHLSIGIVGYETIRTRLAKAVS
jgi:hypothetical protein